MPFCGQRSSPTEGLTPRFRTCVSVGPTRQPNVATDGHEAKPFIRERQNVTQLPAQGALSPCWERTPRLGLVSTNNYEHSDFVRRRWTKRRSRWRPTEMDHEITVPTSSARGILRAPAPRGMPWHEEVRSDQTTARADQALDERRGDPERRVRHHFERAAREAEIGQRQRERLSRCVDRTDSANTRRAVDAAQSQQPALPQRRVRELSIQFPHRRRGRGHRGRRQRLRRRGAPNDYRVDATPTVARGSRAWWTITMKQVMVRP